MVSLGMISGSKCQPATPTHWGPRPQWTPANWGPRPQWPPTPQCIGVARPQRTPARWGRWGRHPNALGWIYPNALGSTPNLWGMMWGQSHMRWVEFSVIVVWRRGMASGRLASTRNVFNRCHLTKRKRCCAVNVADLFDVAAATQARSRSASMSETDGMSQCCRRAPGCATRFRCAPRRTERGSLTCAGRGSPAGRRAPRPFLY